MRTITTEKLPIKMWLDYLEDGAEVQVKNLANFPFAYHHIAIMPDSHQGYGMPIGGVMATDGVIVPNAVGVDIGCGMCAVKTDITEITTDQVKSIMGGIRKLVPVGFDHHKEKQDQSIMPKLADYIDDEETIVNKEYDNALKQVGTLGGGNHFIEIQKGSDGHVWLMVHSGSRNFGLKVANFYNKLAEDMNEKMGHKIPPSWELAYLPLDTKEGHNYSNEMLYCVAFALANRHLMMERIKDAVASTMHNVKFEDTINIAHNYARLEEHFGKKVWVHRKGATLASEETVGIIPGSQGTKSYIVKGKGNTESFQSCSHGAGRKMGRNQARKNLNLEDERKKMEGVVHGIRSVRDLDEAPGAYKDISEVMANQSDLVDILVELTPLGVIKA